MKKFSLLIAILSAGLFTYAQEDGSTLEQPVRTPVEFPWVQEDVGDFSDPVQYVHQRQNDVMYSFTIWRTIDLREKMNHPLYFPVDRRGTWRSLGQVILDAVDARNPENENALPLYYDEFCTNPIPRENILSVLSHSYSTEQIDPDTYEVIGSIDVVNEHAASEILFYNVKEVWFFDKQRSVQDVRILEIEPMIEYERPTNQSYDQPVTDFEEEEVRAATSIKRVGYIYYNELRPFLAQQEVYNVKNNSQRISLDDCITWKRQFNSYIIAEGNPYGDRQIQEYITNARDQRIESENITNKIRVMEHDLWEF